MAIKNAHLYPKPDPWPHHGFPLFRFNIGYLVRRADLKYDPDSHIAYLREMFIAEAIREWPEKYKGWGLFLGVVINPRIPAPFVVMGPSRDTRNKIASFGLHIHPRAFEDTENPSASFLNLVFDAMEELYLDKFKKKNPGMELLRKEALERDIATSG